MATITQHLIIMSLVVLHSAQSQGLTDNRCYLENGASAESFFVSEDSPIGSIIGQLRIHGDPRPGIGNIALRLKEIDSPVDIPSGTKNLTLRKRVDKEGRIGPSSVYVSVICDRLHTNDPGFVIPLNVRVTDANDNAPHFVNAPYILNISEVTVVGTRVLQGVRAIDDDQQGLFSTVRYLILPGPHSDYFVFENELEGTLVLKRPLDYETLKSFTVTIRAQDQGNPPQSSNTELHVNVIDADDQNPRFVDERYTAFLPEPPIEGAPLRIQPKNIRALDQDTGINAPIFYTFNSATNDYRLFEIGRESGQVVLKQNVKDDALLPVTTLVIRATQTDNSDRYALTTLTISRMTSTMRDIRFLQRIYHVTAPENLPGGSIIATLNTNHPRNNLRYYVSDQHLLEAFTIDSTGELALRKQLDYETRDSYVFKVFVTDGKTNDSSVVNVSVINVNDWEPRFRYPQYEFFMSASLAREAIESEGRLVGRVEAADGDRGDFIHLSLTGPNANMFTVNTLGEIRLRLPLPDPMPSTPVHLTAIATDSGRPPRQTSVPVTIHFPQRTTLTDAGWTHKGADGGLLLLMIFAALLVILAIVIAVLVTYICKVKKPKLRSNVEEEEVQQQQQDKSVKIAKKIENPMFGGDTLRATPVATAMGGMPSDVYTATVKSIMSRNGTLRSIIDNSNTLKNTSEQNQSENDKLQNNLNDHNNDGPNWATITTAIPTRVKKLSWGDNSQNKTEDDSVENVNNIDTTNLDPIQRIADNSNLTVYF